MLGIKYAKGVIAYGEGDYLDALSHLRRAVDLEPRHPEARFYLGLTFFRLGEFQYAINTLKWVLHLDPSSHYVHHHLGAAYLQLRRFEEALAQFRLAEQHDAANSDTQFYLDYTYYQLKQYRQAPPYLQRALELDPSLAGAAYYFTRDWPFMPLSAIDWLRPLLNGPYILIPPRHWLARPSAISRRSKAANTRSTSFGCKAPSVLNTMIMWCWSPMMMCSNLANSAMAEPCFRSRHNCCPYNNALGNWVRRTICFRTSILVWTILMCKVTPSGSLRNIDSVV
ncbi:hypothetical protein C2W62_13780 [Candidatus Entotheonella serta]|nr:hypothetical protein C2W62_13780 [Candidatus Entotheonella serta]